MKATIHGRKIRVGLVGCGRISASHVKAIQNFPNAAELVAVCDLVPTKADETAKTTGARPYSSLGEMLKDGSIDIVSICTPSGLHPEHGIECARAGKHVLSEKPMAVRWEDGLKMVEECRKNDVRLFVVKQNRLNPTIQYIKKALTDGRFGKIHTITSNVFWSRPQDYYDQAKWRGTWALDGGAFMNQASHYVDMMTYLGGEISEVSAMIATQARKIEAEDSGVANFRYKSGGLGAMAITMLTYPKNMEGSVTVLGEKGSVRVGGVALNSITHLELSDLNEDDQKAMKLGYEPTSVYGNGHMPYYENVFNTLSGREDAFTNGDDGLVSLQTLIAIYRSAKEKRVISLPLEGFSGVKK